MRERQIGLQHQGLCQCGLGFLRLAGQSQRHRQEPPGTRLLWVPCNRCPTRADGLLVTPEREQCHVANDRRIEGKERIARAQAMRLLENVEPAFGLSARCEPVTEPGMPQREIRIELDRLREVHQRGLWMTPSRMSETQYQVSPWLLIVELDRARAGIKRALGEFVDRPAG